MLDKVLPRNKKVRTGLYVAWDLLAVRACAYGALWLRFDLNASSIPPSYLWLGLRWWALQAVIVLAVYWQFGLYSELWGAAGLTEAMTIAAASAVAGVVQMCGLRALGGFMPKSYHVLWTVLLLGMTAGSRMSYKTCRVIGSRMRRLREGAGKTRVMIVGAGEAGAMIIKELKNSGQTSSEPVCAVDDDPAKKGRLIHGVPVKGDRNAIITLARTESVDEIIIAMPAAGAKSRKEIVEICQQTGCKLRILPGIYQLINGEVSVARLRRVELEDLLGREPVRVSLDEITGYVRGKVVLVTGGGGSIGSELCRQLSGQKVKQLIILDIYENNAYEIQQELKRSHPELDLKVLIGSVRNRKRLESVFERYRPQIVYHAAAHKHVPLMEESPCEAIKNNVVGTYETARCARAYQAERFILISTDKAVNPANIMGASKRLCEMVIQMYGREGGTQYAAVRFGNVLGSNGSVVPLFKKQIERGGPVTVTHPEIIRYFMTIPEAVSLVLQAGAYARGGEIFVLNMGEPVKIAKMAEKLIRLSGYEPYRDIEIQYTGLRPGEKLYEELLTEEEGLRGTENSRIYIGRPVPMDRERFWELLERLREAAEEEREEIRELVREAVPEYRYENRKLEQPQQFEVTDGEKENMAVFPYHARGGTEVYTGGV